MVNELIMILMKAAEIFSAFNLPVITIHIFILRWPKQ